MKYGAMDYIEKPFTEDELRMFVKLALIKRRDRIEKQLKPRVHVIGPAESEQALSGEFSIPGGVLISAGHCWASLAEDGTAKLGVDDFARKLLGRVDAIALPEVGLSVKAGQALFSVSQGNRHAQFHAPLSGKVASVNRELRRDPGMFKDYPYGKNWICVVTAEDLDAELPKLKIGKSAVTFFQEEIERFRAFLQKLSGDEIPDPATFCIGALEKLDDAHWEAAVSEFFAR
jgi:glycine cleavage system H lipoate-binding protein